MWQQQFSIYDRYIHTAALRYQFQSYMKCVSKYILQISLTKAEQFTTQSMYNMVNPHTIRHNLCATIKTHHLPVLLHSVLDQAPTSPVMQHLWLQFVHLYLFCYSCLHVLPIVWPLLLAICHHQTLLLPALPFLSLPPLLHRRIPQRRTLQKPPIQLKYFDHSFTTAGFITIEQPPLSTISNFTERFDALRTVQTRAFSPSVHKGSKRASPTPFSLKTSTGT